MSVVVITGSNSGFGLQGALAFARNGDTVIATMRNIGNSAPLLEQAAAESLRVQVMPLDISKSDTFSEFVDTVVNEHERIDVLVNNAGIHRAGALEDISESDLRCVMETNCIGPLLLTRAVLPCMRQQQGGLVIMMSSLSGIAGLAGDLPYAASKFALEGATEALRHEVDRWGIRVALVQAGLYRTGIMAHNLNDPTALPEHYPVDSPYRPLIEWQLETLRERLPEALDPLDVANLFVEIANGDESQLRWPADAIARKVLATMFAQNDRDRDDFLVGVSGVDWWSRGKTTPQE